MTVVTTLAEALRALPEALAEGQVVILGTETVYGFAARVDQPRGIAALRRLKSREGDQPLQVLTPSPMAARKLAATWPDAVDRIASACWPGPLTLILPAAPSAPPAVVAPDGSIGLRCPGLPDLLALLAITGPLAASSANLRGEPPALDCATAEATAEGAVDWAWDTGPSAGGQPSTVARWTPAGIEVLRPGPVSLAELTALAAGGDGDGR